MFHDVCVHAESTAKEHADAPSIRKGGIWHDSCLQEAEVIVEELKVGIFFRAVACGAQQEPIITALLSREDIVADEITKEVTGSCEDIGSFKPLGGKLGSAGGRYFMVTVVDERGRSIANG